MNGLININDIILKYTPNKLLFELILNKKINNSIRLHSIYNKEKSPSLYIFYYDKKKDWFFKDFSSNTFGTPVVFLKDKLKITYNESCAILSNKLINYYIKGNTYIEEEIISTVKEKTEQSIKDYYNIDYTYQAFEKQDLDYFASGGISLETLYKFSVSPIIRIKSKEIFGQKVKTETRMFAYLSKEGVPIQFYCPKYKGYCENKKVFISTSLAANWIYGYDFITINKATIIASSLKDMMSLYELIGDKYNIIAFTSEKASIPNQLLTELSFSDVYVLYDNDTHGKTNSLLLKEKYPIIKIIDWQLEKDVFDAIQKYGKEKVLKNLTSLLSKS